MLILNAMLGPMCACDSHKKHRTKRKKQNMKGSNAAQVFIFTAPMCHIQKQTAKLVCVCVLVYSAVRYNLLCILSSALFNFFFFIFFSTLNFPIYSYGFGNPFLRRKALDVVMFWFSLRSCTFESARVRANIKYIHTHTHIYSQKIKCEVFMKNFIRT